MTPTTTRFMLPRFVDIAEAMSSDINRVDLHAAAATMAAMVDAADPTGWAFDDARREVRDEEEVYEFLLENHHREQWRRQRAGLPTKRFNVSGAKAAARQWVADRDAEEAAEFGGGDLRVPWWAEMVEDCNSIDPDQQGRTPLMSDEVWA